MFLGNMGKIAVKALFDKWLCFFFSRKSLILNHILFLDRGLDFSRLHRRFLDIFYFRLDLSLLRNFLGFDLLLDFWFFLFLRLKDFWFYFLFLRCFFLRLFFLFNFRRLNLRRFLGDLINFLRVA